MFSSTIFRFAQFEDHAKTLSLGIGKTTVRYAVSLRNFIQDWRHDSVVMSKCSFKGPNFDFQQPNEVAHNPF